MRLHKLTVILLLCLLSLASAAAAPRAAPAAITECPNGTCTMYISAVSYDPRPLLIAPADGQEIGSLAPLLTWQPGMTGVHQIQLSQDPEFSPFSTMVLSTTKSISGSSTGLIQTKIPNNLSPSGLYYWRVGYPTPLGYEYGPVSGFYTPAAGSIALPPIPTLLSPKNNARLPKREVTLSWQAIPDALFYRVRVYLPDGTRFSSDDVTAPATSLDITGLPARTTLHWRVKVLGTTGWSDDYSADRFFITP